MGSKSRKQHKFSLNWGTIASFCRTNSDKARKLMLELSNYLRRNIQDNREFITLRDELKQIQSYLKIEHARFGDRVQFEMNVCPESCGWYIPPLLIQPLVENAVKHGLSGREEGGKIWVRANCDNNNLFVQVEDDGVGMPRNAIDQVYKKNGFSQANMKVGLRNVNQRLENIFGPKYRLQIRSQYQKGTTITINLPFTSYSQKVGSERMDVVSARHSTFTHPTWASQNELLHLKQ